MTNEQVEHELEEALKKIEIIEHALGDKTHYRNRYIVGEEHKNYAMVTELAEAGYMEASCQVDELVMYRVTDKGKTIAFHGQ